MNNLLPSGIAIPAGNYMFKVNDRNARRRCEICSKLTIKTRVFNIYKCEAEKRKTWSNHRRSHLKVFCKKDVLKIFLQKKDVAQKYLFKYFCLPVCLVISFSCIFPFSHNWQILTNFQNCLPNDIVFTEQTYRVRTF